MPLSVSSWQKLSQREREVLKLIAEGYKNKEIAEDLCISLKTVEKHRANLMKKIDLHNAAGLTVYAVEKELGMAGTEIVKIFGLTLPAVSKAGATH